MALDLRSTYSGQVSTTDAGYPYGKAQDETVSGDGTGTPLEAAWVNDIWGFLQAILYAGGVTPSGTPDSVTASDYLTALADANWNWSGRHVFAQTVKVGGTYVQFQAPVTGRQDWLRLGGNVTGAGSANDTCVNWDSDGNLVPAVGHATNTDLYRVHFKLPPTAILTGVTGVVFHGGAYTTTMQVKRRTNGVGGAVSANVGAPITFSASGLNVQATATLSEIATNTKDFWAEFAFTNASSSLQGVMVTWTDQVIQCSVT